MRSGYEAVDALDFIPMDAFQKAFWKLRQSEQEAYALQYSPLVVKKGDLSDPLYLDFIAAMQYAVIGREMGRGQQVFTEYCEECEGGRRVVRRDPALAENASLPAEHDRLVGDIIFTGLRDGFRGEVFGGPGALPPSAGLEEVVAGVQALLDVMVNNGFALKSEVTDVEPGQPSRLRIVTRGPANLWGLNSLTFRRSPVVNAYDALAAAAFLRASGRPPVSVQMTLTDTGVEHTFLLA